MAGTLRAVRFKRPWQNYRVGEMITPNGTQRDWLFAHDYVEEIEARPVKLSKKALDKIAGAKLI